VLKTLRFREGIRPSLQVQVFGVVFPIPANCVAVYFTLVPEPVDLSSFTHTLIFKLDWSVYTCLTQLYGVIDMYNLLHKEQLHDSAIFIGHLRIDK